MATECEDKCAYFVQKRSRNCRMLRVTGSHYCAEHLLHDPSAQISRRRVCCPLDGSHTVFVDQLSRHMRRCNVAKRKVPSCYSKGVHVIKGVMDPAPTSLTHCSQATLTDLIQRIQTLYKIECVGDNAVKEHIASHASMENDLCDPSCGHNAAKHLRQQSSIVAHLDHLSLLTSKDIAYIEFGAGRGKLSEKILSALKDPDNVHLVLVDRANCRHKADGSLRTSGLQGATYHRLVMDIQDLDMRALDVLDCVSSTVAVSKHLCGAATDLALRCLVAGKTDKFRAALIALCCHHRTSWSQLAGREYFTNLGFSSNDFELLRHMTSWSVCGVRPTDQQQKPGYIPHENEQIGIQCKRLIDFARMSYLRNNGFSASLVYYATKNTSLENVLLIVK